MGFYGSVIYEFTKMFSRLKVTRKNDNEIPITPPENNSSLLLEAGSMWEQVILEPSNRWIQFDGITGNAVEKTISIGHGTTGERDNEKTTVSVAAIEELPEDTTAQLLQSGGYLQIATEKYDAAGHFIDYDELDDLPNPSYSYLQLPVPTLTFEEIKDDGTTEIQNIVPNEDDKLQIESDSQWIQLEKNENALKILHTIDADTTTKEEMISFTCLIPEERLETTTLTPEEFKTAMSDIDKKDDADVEAMTPILDSLSSDIKIIPLKSGDLVQAYRLEKDANGHIISNENTYYKLPVSLTDQNFDDHTTRITNLETRLTSGELSGGTEYGTYEDNVQKIYDNTNLVRRQIDQYSVETMYPGIDMDTPSVYATIGYMTGENSVKNAIDRLTEKPASGVIYYTVSDAIQELVDYIKQQDDTIKQLKRVVKNTSNDLETTENIKFYYGDNALFYTDVRDYKQKIKEEILDDKDENFEIFNGVFKEVFEGDIDE